MHRNQNFTGLQHTTSLAEAYGWDQDLNISQLLIEKKERLLDLHGTRAIRNCSTNSQDIT